MKKENEKEKEKQIQENYIELQRVASGLKELQRNIQVMDEQIIEVLSVTQALKDLGEVKVGTKAFMPIASGIFVKAELKENKELLVNVGANVSVIKSVDEAIHMLESKMEELKIQRQSFLQDLEELGTRAQELEEELNALLKNV